MITPTIGGTAGTGFGDCVKGTAITSTYTVASDTYLHAKAALAANCQTYIPNF